MPPTFQQKNRMPKPAGDHGKDGASKAGADDGQIEIAHAAHFAQGIRGCAICVKFIRCSRATRKGKQASQSENFSRSHKSAKTRPRLRLTPYSDACSRVKSFGGENWP